MDEPRNPTAVGNRLDQEHPILAYVRHRAGCEFSDAARELRRRANVPAVDPKCSCGLSKLLADVPIGVSR